MNERFRYKTMQNFSLILLLIITAAHLEYTLTEIWKVSFNKISMRGKILQNIFVCTRRQLCLFCFKASVSG